MGLSCLLGFSVYIQDSINKNVSNHEPIFILSHRKIHIYYYQGIIPVASPQGAISLGGLGEEERQENTEKLKRRESGGF